MQSEHVNMSEYRYNWTKFDIRVRRLVKDTISFLIDISKNVSHPDTRIGFSFWLSENRVLSVDINAELQQIKVYIENYTYDLDAIEIKINRFSTGISVEEINNRLSKFASDTVPDGMYFVFSVQNFIGGVCMSCDSHNKNLKALPVHKASTFTM